MGLVHFTSMGLAPKVCITRARTWGRLVHMLRLMAYFRIAAGIQ